MSPIMIIAIKHEELSTRVIENKEIVVILAIEISVSFKV